MSSIWIRGYLDNPSAFYRTMEQTGQKPWPVLPLAIVCRACRHAVDIEASHCDSCGEMFYVECGHKGSSKKKGPKISICPGPQPRAREIVADTPIPRQFYGGMLPLSKLGKDSE